MGRRTAVFASIAALGLACASSVGFTAPVFDVGLFRLSPPRPPPALAFTYRGWRVDAQAAVRAQAPEKTIRLVKDQLDIVEQAGLKPPFINSLRAIPITVVAGAGPEPAVYIPGRGVQARARLLDAKKPIILRQLLTAWYDQQMSPSARAAAGRYRLQIVGRKVWPKSAAMLQNDPDFFAITATAYLNGAITREPYNRANLRKTQPDYYQWLARLFDDGRARH